MVTMREAAQTAAQVEDLAGSLMAQVSLLLAENTRLRQAEVTLTDELDESRRIRNKLLEDQQRWIQWKQHRDEESDSVDETLLRVCAERDELLREIDGYKLGAANEAARGDGLDVKLRRSRQDLKTMTAARDRLSRELAVMEADRDRLKAVVAEYEGTICWETTCLNCASILDASYQQTVRAEQAEAALAEAQAEIGMWEKQYGETALQDAKAALLSLADHAGIPVTGEEIEAALRHRDEQKQETTKWRQLAKVLERLLAVSMRSNVMCKHRLATTPEELAGHLAECSPAGSAIVAQEGSADTVVNTLAEDGWELSEVVEYVAGKRIRVMRPPNIPGVKDQAVVDDVETTGVGHS